MSTLVLQVAALFEKCERKSDIGYNDDPKIFVGYHQSSCTAFERYACLPDSGLDSTAAAICSEGLKRMYMKPTSAESKAVKYILEVCHELDLPRCYGADKMQPKLEKLERDVGKATADLLWSGAEEAIIATGDRMLFSRFSSVRSYEKARFSICGKEPSECLKAVDGALEPFHAKLSGAVKIVPSTVGSSSLKPVPVEGEGKVSLTLAERPCAHMEVCMALRMRVHIRGCVCDDIAYACAYMPSQVRFASSRYKLMHAAQVAKWKQLEWDDSETFEQSLEVIKALKVFITVYCKSKGVKWIHDDKAPAQGKIFFDKLLSTAQKERQPHLMVARLWTSPAKLAVSHFACR